MPPTCSAPWSGPSAEGRLATVVVVPLTTQDRRSARALRVPSPARDRLLCDSVAMADLPRSLDPSHLGDGPLASLSRQDLAEPERALLGVLGIGLP
ncbi:MAG: type II toxin-antitoxin system PemK/MazF family toxin [Cyanobacteriota bacterium]|nr:type II toxin-antitoxin system PemK/MazF family toxin [Cyanobacteriota bacterium]